MTRARYTWHDDGRCLLIFDESNGGKSVTNDAEQVIADFAERGIDVDQRRVIYRDSTGLWDGMATRDGRFVAFILLGRTDMGHAIAAAWQRNPWEP
jgi:hypothetical protein